MIVTLAFAQPDVQAAIDLLGWIKLLGGCPKHRILLVADAATEWWKCKEAMDIARSCFAKVTLITNDRPVRGWPEGANSLFAAAATHVHQHVKEPFFWLEPDACPMKAGWLEAIEAEYDSAPTAAFMGHIYSSDTPGLAPRLMSGIAVYPPVSVFGDQAATRSAWDVRNADKMVTHGKHTDLIYNFWGQRNLSPTFVETRSHDSPVNAFTLANIPEKAVVFHRCKNNSLLQLLKKKLFPNELPLLVVIPFCGKDVEAALRNVQWIAELGGAKNYQCLLSYDDQTRRDRVNEIVRFAQHAFEKVEIHAYRIPGSFGWPEGANKAFQQAARFIQQNHRKPWLWLESDAVPVASNWLDQLSAAYQRCGKAFFGPIVPDRGHMNGVAIYPWNTASRCPRAMNSTSQAWDWVGKDEMIRDACNAEPIIQHVWGFHGGRPHPHAGDPIRFNSVDEVKRWVHPSACIFHRSKFGDLQNLLRQMRQ